MLYEFPTKNSVLKKIFNVNVSEICTFNLQDNDQEHDLYIRSIHANIIMIYTKNVEENFCKLFYKTLQKCK